MPVIHEGPVDRVPDRGSRSSGRYEELLDWVADTGRTFEIVVETWGQASARTRSIDGAMKRTKSGKAIIYTTRQFPRRCVVSPHYTHTGECVPMDRDEMLAGRDKKEEMDQHSHEMFVEDPDTKERKKIVDAVGVYVKLSPRHHARNPDTDRPPPQLGDDD